MKTGSIPHGVTSRRFYTSVARVGEMSMAGLIESLRMAIIVAPLLFAMPGIARAESIETIDYEVVGESGPPHQSVAIAQFGPFAVINPSLAELNGETAEGTPALFRRMLAAFPGIKRINMVECAGTVDDEANLEVARMIRRAGIDTHVPAHGSVRSGGVELFMAGVHRTHDHGAEFGVHSWEDDEGNQAKDVPVNDPVNREYVSYYQSVGLPAETARAFYAFTNATPFDRIHYMTEQELARFRITD